MTQNIRTALAPLLITSYVCGLRIIEFPIGHRHPRIWFSLLYMLLLWLLYCFLLKSIKFFFNIRKYTIEFFIGFVLDHLVTLLSIVFGVYHNKKFSSCLRKLDIVDKTMLNVGMTTDYYNLQKKIIYLVLGWLLMVIIMSYAMSFWMKKEYNYDTLTSMFCAVFVETYCSNVNILNDLIVASIFGYIGLKFDQVNQLLLNLTIDKRGVEQAWENSIHQHRFPQASSDRWMIWIVIHLHTELRKISCQIDSIFGVQMTLKMACNFFWIAIELRELFSAILVNNFIKLNKILFIIIMLIWLFLNILKLFFINYVCEIVSSKAHAVKSLINKIPYSTCDVEVRENMSQLLLQIIQAPVRFCGIGLFQYGYKFFYGFSSSIATVVVLLVQAYITKGSML